MLLCAFRVVYSNTSTQSISLRNNIDTPSPFLLPPSIKCDSSQIPLPDFRLGIPLCIPSSTINLSTTLSTTLDLSLPQCPTPPPHLIHDIGRIPRFSIVESDLDTRDVPVGGRTTYSVAFDVKRGW